MHGLSQRETPLAIVTPPLIFSLLPGVSRALIVIRRLNLINFFFEVPHRRCHRCSTSLLLQCGTDDPPFVMAPNCVRFFGITPLFGEARQQKSVLG